MYGKPVFLVVRRTTLGECAVGVGLVVGVDAPSFKTCQMVVDKMKKMGKKTELSASWAARPCRRP